MQWHEQVVVDRKREYWAGMRQIAVLFLAFVVVSFFFLQWATQASATGELRRLMANRIVTQTAQVLAGAPSAPLPQDAPVGEVQVTDREIGLAIGSLWDVLPSDLPQVMTFEVVVLEAGEDVIVLARTADRGGGLDAPKDWACRRLRDGRTSGCDPDLYDPSDAVRRWSAVARR